MIFNSVILITKNKVRRNRTYGTSLPDKFLMDTAGFMHSSKMGHLMDEHYNTKRVQKSPHAKQTMIYWGIEISWPMYVIGQNIQLWHQAIAWLSMEIQKLDFCSRNAALVSGYSFQRCCSHRPFFFFFQEICGILKKHSIDFKPTFIVFRASGLTFALWGKIKNLSLLENIL